MPTPSANYQASLNGLLMGATTVYQFGSAGIDGLGLAKPKTADIPLDQADGSYGSPDYRDVQTLLLHIEIIETDDAAAFTALDLLCDAFAPVSANIDLHIQLPGSGAFFYTGRPRGVDVASVANAKTGCITVIAQFDALDPIRHAE